MAIIKERMRAIQQKYLIRAGYEFQHVLNDFEHIVSGQRLVESDILASIRDAADNNVRVERLEQYATVVLPIINDKAAAAPEIRSTLIQAANRASAMPVTPMDTPIGSMPGATYGDVLDGIIRIFADLRYVEPDEAYAAYVDLFLASDEMESKQKIVKAVSELSRHSVHVWERVGPAVQEILLDAVTATPPEQLVKTRPLMIEVAEQCLRSEVTGSTSTSRSFIWQIGSVTISDRMCIVRDRAMVMLKELFLSSQNEGERRNIYSAMQSATRLPSQGRYSDVLHQRVLVDTRTVIDFMTARIDELDALLKQSIEEDALFDYRRAKAMLGTSLYDEAMRAAIEGVISAALALRDRFNADPEYLIFKTLVGFNSVFNYEWDQEEAQVDFKAKDFFRKERATEYVNQVTDENAEAWFHRLNGYAAIRSDDLAMFPHLGEFIRTVAQNLPVIGSAWLERSRDQPIAKFRPGMLVGLYASDRDAVLEWIEATIDRHEDLPIVAHFIRHAEPALPDMLEKVANAGLRECSDVAVFSVLEACAARPAEFGKELSRQVGVKALNYLSRRGLGRWVEPLSVWGVYSGFLADFDGESRAALFTAIVDLKKIEYRTEAIIAVYAAAYAADIIDIFGSRLERERELNGSDRTTDDRYEAIPYDFSDLHTLMQHSAPLLLPRALEWHRADPRLGQYKSAKMVAIMFPVLPECAVGCLIEYAKSGDRGAQDFVIDVMSNYEGADIAFVVLKELVAVLPADHELLGDVRIALGRTGVLHGEFGRRDALIAEQERLKSWLVDERASVRLFAETQSKVLENAIAAAQQEALSEIAHRRLDYGENLDEPSLSDN